MAQKIIVLKPGEVPHRADAAQAVTALRAPAKAANLGPFDWEEWKQYRDEGRRF